ncbi:hypothetical protein [Saccharopolyspora sp. 5N708]|uniref:hypothetical protein n=1 Tax=Saccharopolyspora sp. 5N708 TaxID=3457424 RepID=UPI003FCFC079
MLAIVTSFMTAPVNDALKDIQLEKKPALIAEDVRSVPGDDDAIYGWYFPKALSTQQVDHLRRVYRDMRADQSYSGESIDQEMIHEGGIRVGSEGSLDSPFVSRHRVNLVGNRSQRVRVNDMRARVLERKSPDGGTFIFKRQAGGGVADLLTVNLDSDDTRLYSVKEDDNGEIKVGSPFLDEESRFAELGEPLPFEIVAATLNCFCTWELVVEVSYENEHESVVVRSDGTSAGKPFETVAAGQWWEYESAYQIIPGSDELMDCNDPAVVNSYSAC